MTAGSRVVLVPGALALLPRYASLTDPVAELRAACERAVSWLGSQVTVVADDSGRAVAEHLLDVVPRDGAEPSYLVVGNGSARRGEASPGPYHPDARDFDAALGEALVAGDLSSVDLSRAEELWARLGGIVELPRLLDGSGGHGPPPGPVRGQLEYADAPFGVQYWVVRWELP